MLRPRERLGGMTLDGGWRVVESLPNHDDDTGGNFSAGYIVTAPDGRRHFLKAIDFSSAMLDPDPARALQRLTEAFNLERDVLEIGKRLSCVVTAIADGRTLVGDTPDDVVQYLILELAENSLRRMAVPSRRLPVELALRALHRAANGLRQLHREQVAHQDIKPSNVLQFPGDEFKISDFGRSSIRGRLAPHDDFSVAGDPAYAPLELLYGQTDPDFGVRRFGCDSYLLGSLATFLLTGVHMTALVISELDPSAHPGTWVGTYGAVLPQVRAAYSTALAKITAHLPREADYGPELVLCITQLCDPDISRRGHPITRATQTSRGNIFDLERYVSIFDRLATRADIYARRARR